MTASLHPILLALAVEIAVITLPVTLCAEVRAEFELNADTYRTQVRIYHDSGSFLLEDIGVDYVVVARIVHAVTYRDGDFFLVIGVREYSRGAPPRGGSCGGGMEAYIEWFRIHDGQIEERQKGLYESCWHYRGGRPPDWVDGKLTAGVSFAIVRDEDYWEAFEWAYDPEKPELGLQEVKTIIPPEEIDKVHREYWLR